MKSALIVLGVIVVAILWFVGAYNGLVSQQEAVNSSWAQVQNVYQRRADLVPNLVETVKGAAKFEKSTLTEVVEARSRVGSINIDKSALEDPAKFKQFEQAQGQLGGAMSRLLLIAEQYPQLRATESFRDLQVQLEGTENRITVERRAFNEVVMNYNASLRSMPTSLVAKFGNFKERPYFEATAQAQTAPTVKF